MSLLRANSGWMVTERPGGQVSSSGSSSSGSSGWRMSAGLTASYSVISHWAGVWALVIGGHAPVVGVAGTELGKRRPGLGHAHVGDRAELPGGAVEAVALGERGSQLDGQPDDLGDAAVFG